MFTVPQHGAIECVSETRVPHNTCPLISGQCFKPASQLIGGPTAMMYAPCTPKHSENDATFSLRSVAVRMHRGDYRSHSQIRTRGLVSNKCTGLCLHIIARFCSCGCGYVDLHVCIINLLYAEAARAWCVGLRSPSIVAVRSVIQSTCSVNPSPVFVGSRKSMLMYIGAAEVVC